MHLDVERSLANLSLAQNGVFRAEQAIAEGCPPWRLEYLVKTGRLIVLHPNVLAFASTPATWHRDQMAAVLWAQPAVAAGRSAAFLHRLPGFEDPPLEIATLNRKIVPRSGIIVHVTKRLPRDQTVVVQGIPSTSVERAVMDLFGGIVNERRAAIALDHSLHLGMATLASYDFCLFLTARRGRNGCGRLRDAIEKRAGMTEFPNTGLETVVFELLATPDLPRPELQVPILENEVFVARPDFLYPDFKVIVEGHSRLWHTGRTLEEGDQIRHDRLVDLGYRIIYVGWEDAVGNPESTVRVISRALTDRGWRPEPSV
jgi:hypothetical protein